MDQFIHYYFYIFFLILIVLEILLILALGQNGLLKIKQEAKSIFLYSLRIFAKTLWFFYLTTIVILLYFFDFKLIQIVSGLSILHFFVITPATLFIQQVYKFFIRTGLVQIILFPLVAPLVLLQSCKYLSLIGFKILWAITLMISFLFIIRGLLLCMLETRVLIANSKHVLNYLTIIMSWLLVTVLNLFCIVIFVNSIDYPSFLIQGTPTNSKLILLYFTVVTFTTTGFGDITACTNLGFLTTILISSLGFLYSALIVGSMLAVFMRKN